MASSADIQKIVSHVESGTVATLSASELASYASLLAHQNVAGHLSAAQYAQVSEVVRIHMLRAMIDSFEQRSRVMQNWMLLFAALAVIAPFVQAFIASPSGETPANAQRQAASASASQAQPPAASRPNLVQPASAGPATAKHSSSSPASASVKSAVP